ncbi:MAG TPA: plasma-membrane proton-efflux P-type ATPase, partial [Burkholderiaceae bacterium]|nr:plasma-membrane proton-efflux P-type ATPase [Burkholderiaceae bacterium]
EAEANLAATTGLSERDAADRLSREGPNEVPEAPSHPVRRLLKKFWGLSAWMLELIAVLSFVLHKHADFWIALALLVVNAILSFLQEQRASSAVAALRRRLQVTARVLRDGAWRLLPARELVAADVVRLRAGDFVPADARVAEGDLRVDQSALTGESAEVARHAGDTLYSGSIVRRGEATVVVTATGVRTYYGRTTHLIESARPKLHVEEITTRLVKWLFVVVGTMVGIAFVLSIARGLSLLEIVPLSLVLLMSAVPVALPVMFTVSTAVGSMELGRRGVLVTHLAAVEDAANMDVLCADKTGTLTLNRLALGGVFAQQGFSDDDVVRTAALASNAANQDPIDLGFLRAAGERDVLDAGAETLNFVPFSPETRRTESTTRVQGRTTRSTKGALRTISALAGLPPERIAALEARAAEEAAKGSRVLAVARSDGDAPWQLVGLAFLADPPRPDSRQLIEQLRALGIGVKMLTGDGLPVAREIARQLGLGDVTRAPDLRAAEKEGAARAGDLVARADGFAEVFPEDKFLVVKSQQSAGHVVGMTGDGVNDAPALSQAEVGIAVSGATDVAKGAASIVLTEEGLASIVDLVKIGRSIYQRVLTWIINKVSRTILKAGFVVVAFIVTGQFVISALGMVLLVFMTDFVKIALSTDRVSPSPAPESWRIGPLVQVAVVLGVLMLVEALGLLAIGSHLFDLSGGRLQTFSFLTLLLFAVFSIVSIRERRAFWRSRPGWVLAVALAADALIGVAIAHFGLAELGPLPFEQIAFVGAYALVCSLLLNDIVKVVLTERLWTAPRRAAP